ncbi:MAG: copper resistance protein CopC [Acetobacteraceae bacterium]|nr:copper resistance protein CopC [Acetobacteraceae bacterium]
MTYARGFVLALMVWVLGAGLALGHSGLQRAEPPVESKLKRPPSEVRLYFSEGLEPAYSTVRVTNDNGAEVDRRDAHVDPSNPLLLRVTLPPLEHGTYTVTWRVLSVDSHVTEGLFTFRVE